MFPYAAGRRLAHILDTKLKLDISGFSACQQAQDIGFRQYSLGVFNIHAEIATSEEILALTSQEAGWLDKLFRRKPRRPASYVKEKHYHFDPDILELKGDIYLAGNWNSERYFADIADIVRHEFKFKRQPVGRNLKLLGAISSVESVSLHVRRGDYVSNAKASQVHGLCGLDYYRAAVDLIARRVPHPRFFIFSDDPVWVRENLQLDWPYELVDHNGPLDGHEDMRLMSHCKHNIIANSGFSWWAAWLNGSPHKIVVAPKKWFRIERYDTSTLIPEGWIQL